MLRIIIFLLIITFSSKKLFAENIPIIVISAGKTYQSKSIVGSDVVIVDSKAISESNEFFLGDVLSKNLNGMNYFQSGGHGTTSGVQLRGLPKRYSTVYIDGVKVSDPSSPSNDYYFGNLMKGSIDRVEILKGTQSSLYGSSAIGGTINLFTKKGKEGHHNDIEVSTGSNDTKNFNISFDGKENNYDYFVGFNKFLTDGISAMNDNDEKDKYYNDSVVANFGYNINDKFRLENYLRYADSYLEYDEVTSGRTDGNNTDDEESSYSLRLIRDDGNLKNTLSYNNTYIKRSVIGYSGTNDIYWGYRDAINLIGEYNFNYDTKIVYGLDNEFDRADFTTWSVTGNLESDEAVYSQYIDLQFRPTEKIYSTIGLRRDDHTTAGAYETGRITFAYIPDKRTKFRSSLGTGIRFPSLNDYFYDYNVDNKEDLVPEKSTSFDFGIEKFIEKHNLNLDLTLFHVIYDDNLSNWIENTDNGKGPSQTIQNSEGNIKSRGFELTTKWKPEKTLSFDLGYTFTDAYDGEDCDDPDYAKYQADWHTCLDEMPVRVPRHSMNASINKKINNKINTSLLIKYAAERRDYGNANTSNGGYNDVILDDYVTVDLSGNYNLFNKYKIYFSASNIFDVNYEEGYQYSTPGRNLNFGIRKVY